MTSVGAADRFVAAIVEPRPRSRGAGRDVHARVAREVRAQDAAHEYAEAEILAVDRHLCAVVGAAKRRRFAFPRRKRAAFVAVLPHTVAPQQLPGAAAKRQRADFAGRGLAVPRVDDLPRVVFRILRAEPHLHRRQRTAIVRCSCGGRKRGDECCAKQADANGVAHNNTPGFRIDFGSRRCFTARNASANSGGRCRSHAGRCSRPTAW